jgi:hypothetical protein
VGFVHCCLQTIPRCLTAARCLLPAAPLSA